MQSIADPKTMAKALRADLASQTADSGFIWMRVDDGHNNILRFDSMTKRPENGPLKGSQDWVDRSIVLDIPEAVQTIHYGFLLKGRGTLWAKNFRLDTVGPEIKTTERNGKVLTKPENLSFSFA